MVSVINGSVNAIDPVPPRIYSVVLNSTTITYRDNVTVIVNDTDLETNITMIVLYYTPNYGATWIAVNGTENGSLYIFIIPRYKYGTNITYYVFACDSLGNNVTTGYYSYVVDDTYKPNLDAWINGKRYALENITIYANATEEFMASGVDTVYMDAYISLNNDSWTYDNTYILSLKNGSLYTQSLQFSRGSLYVKIIVYAIDKAGNQRTIKLFFYIDKRPVAINGPSNITVQYKDSANVTFIVTDKQA